MVNMLALTKELTELREKAVMAANKFGEEARVEFNDLMVKINEVKVKIDSLLKEEDASSK